MDIPFCIDSRVIGTSQHLVIDGTERTYVDDVPSGVWHLSGRQKDASDRCLDTLFALEKFAIELEPQQRYVDSYRTFVPDKLWPPPWKSILSFDAHSCLLEGIVSKVVEYLPQCDSTFYKNTWGIQTTVFESLRRATVRENVFDALKKANPDNVPLTSFAPNHRELAKKIVYDRTSTRTGRATVESGPQILTLRRDLRQVICPSGPERSIRAYDFKACEMHVLLYETGHPYVQGDLYEILGAQHLPGVPRKVVKGAIISREYGQSPHVWGPELGLNREETNRVNDVLSHLFNNSLLLDRLRVEYAAKGFIRNRFGRKVAPSSGDDYILKNAYAQSTGVDVATLGFAAMLNGFERLDVHPLFLIHDCIVIDAPNSTLTQLSRLNKVRVRGYDQCFNISFDDIVKD